MAALRYGYGPPAFIASGLQSETIASGATSAAATLANAINAARVKAIGGAMYVSIGAAPDPSVNPRLHLADGESFDLVNPRGLLIKAVDA